MPSPLPQPTQEWNLFPTQTGISTTYPASEPKLKLKCDLLYADDLALNGNNIYMLQQILDALAECCEKFRLTSSSLKTLTLSNGDQSSTSSCWNHSKLQAGSTLTLNSGISLRTVTFGCLSKKCWDNKHLTIYIKVEDLWCLWTKHSSVWSQGTGRDAITNFDRIPHPVCLVNLLVSL